MNDPFLKCDVPTRKTTADTKESDSAGNLGIGDELAEAFAECFVFND